MANSNTSEILEALAADIGETLYIDVAKWHLYLADAHLHTVVAEQVYSFLNEKSLEENAVLQVLREIPVKLGGGKLEIPLADLIPASCFADLMELLKEYRDKY
jgi:Protein of unknown function (DUF3181)